MPYAPQQINNKKILFDKSTDYSLWNLFVQVECCLFKKKCLITATDKIMKNTKVEYKKQQKAQSITKLFVIFTYYILLECLNEGKKVAVTLIGTHR